MGMNYDCCFTKENNWFRYRTGGIVVHGGKMLFVKCIYADYYYMVGGGVFLGETSKDCMEREIFEETGMKLKAKHLSVVCENFFKGKDGLADGCDCHVLEYYYLLEVSDEDIKNCKTLTDNGEPLVWIPFEDFDKVVIKPDFIKERIDEIVNTDNVIHVIEERDR